MPYFDDPFVSEIECDGSRHPIEIARLTVAEYGELKLQYSRFVQRSTPRGVPVRKASEEAKDDKGAYVLTDDQVWALRDAERDPDETDRMWAIRLRETQAHATFIERIIPAYVRIPTPWSTARGREIKTGADLLLQFGHQDYVLSQLQTAIYWQNTLPEDLRKNLPSPPDLLRLSPDQGTAVRTGEKPDSVAPSVESGDLTSSGDVMASLPSSETQTEASSEENPSGGTETPTLTLVPSDLSQPTSSLSDGGSSRPTRLKRSASAA